MLRPKMREIEISTDQQLQNCMDSKITVQLYLCGELDYTGTVVGFSADSIETECGLYLRENCIVKTKKNYLKLLKY